MIIPSPSLNQILSVHGSHPKTENRRPSCRWWRTTSSSGHERLWPRGPVEGKVGDPWLIGEGWSLTDFKIYMGTPLDENKATVNYTVMSFHRLHVWYMCLDLADFSGSSRQIYQFLPQFELLKPWQRSPSPFTAFRGGRVRFGTEFSVVFQKVPAGNFGRNMRKDVINGVFLGVGTLKFARFFSRIRRAAHGILHIRNSTGWWTI